MEDPTNDLTTQPSQRLSPSLPMADVADQASVLAAQCHYRASIQVGVVYGWEVVATRRRREFVCSTLRWTALHSAAQASMAWHTSTEHRRACMRSLAHGRSHTSTRTQGTHHTHTHTHVLTHHAPPHPTPHHTAVPARGWSGGQSRAPARSGWTRSKSQGA